MQIIFEVITGIWITSLGGKESAALYRWEKIYRKNCGAGSWLGKFSPLSNIRYVSVPWKVPSLGLLSIRLPDKLQTTISRNWRAVLSHQEARPELSVITLNVFHILSKFSHIEFEKPSITANGACLHLLIPPRHNGASSMLLSWHNRMYYYCLRGGHTFKRKAPLQ